MKYDIITMAMLLGLSCTLPMQAQSVKQREISKRAEANPEDIDLKDGMPFTRRMLALCKTKDAPRL